MLVGWRSTRKVLSLGLKGRRKIVNYVDAEREGESSVCFFAVCSSFCCGVLGYEGSDGGFDYILSIAACGVGVSLDAF